MKGKMGEIIMKIIKATGQTTKNILLIMNTGSAPVLCMTHFHSKNVLIRSRNAIILGYLYCHMLYQ